ncbi:MAG: hypothetical protein M0R28_17325 [Pigmentiphaga sp.]|nr:hypothetical protein [Pigmentiphaga sp.]
MNPIAQFFRFVVLVLLALAGFAMAVVFLASTAIALGVLYIIAKLRGQPFAPAAYWASRRQNMRWQFNRGRWTPPDPQAAPQRPASRPGAPKRPDPQIIDVEVRDIR